MTYRYLFRPIMNEFFFISSVSCIIQNQKVFKHASTSCLIDEKNEECCIIFFSQHTSKKKILQNYMNKNIIFKPTKMTFHVSESVLLNQTCEINAQCMGTPYATCRRGVCTCIEGYTPTNSSECVLSM